MRDVVETVPEDFFPGLNTFASLASLVCAVVHGDEVTEPTRVSVLQ
jgi:hypothetical protein